MKSLSYPTPGRESLLISLGLIFLAISLPVSAWTFQPTELQYALMPEFCQARMSDFHVNRKGRWNVQFPINEAQIDYWKKSIGPDWRHLHHYCGALVYRSQAQDPDFLRRSNRSARQYWSRTAEAIDYTRSRSKRGAPLWNLMTVDYADALAHSGKVKTGLQLLTDLIAQSPGDVDAYIALAKILESEGDTERAMEVLRGGMSKVSTKGPLLFYLAHWSYDAGDLEQARSTLVDAESAGMKMDSLRAKLGMSK